MSEAQRPAQSSCPGAHIALASFAGRSALARSTVDASFTGPSRPASSLPGASRGAAWSGGPSWPAPSPVDSSHTSSETSSSSDSSWPSVASAFAIGERWSEHPSPAHARADPSTIHRQDISIALKRNTSARTRSTHAERSAPRLVVVHRSRHPFRRPTPHHGSAPGGEVTHAAWRRANFRPKAIGGVTAPRPSTSQRGSVPHNLNKIAR